MSSKISNRITESKCYRYAEDAATGQIRVGIKVRQGAQRFLNDLEKIGSPGYRWTFDIDKANRPIEFIEKFMRPTKGAYENMTLLPWQHFTEGNLYGWVDKETRMRRFRTGLIIVASGNGKSTLVSGNAAYAASKDGERGAEVCLLANSEDQVKKIVFAECKTQIESSPMLAKHFRTTLNAIYYDKTNSVILPLCSKSETLDGSNPHLAIFDEIHEYKDHKLVNIINKKKIKRRQPLTLYITTLGNVIDGPLMDLYVFASDILEDIGAVSERAADRFFAYIAEIDEGDDPEDITCWEKANPSMGHLVMLDDLVDEWEQGKYIPAQRSDFINKQLNVFTSVDELSFLDKQVILKNNKTYDVEKLEGRRCYGGFDLAEREDFTSAGLEFPLDNGYVFYLSHTWVPERKVKMDSERLDYHGMKREGVLTICPGEYVDYTLVLDWYLQMQKLYKILSVGYDPANAWFLVREMEKKGFVMNVVRQGALTLNDPTKNLKECFLDGKVITNNNRMYRWSLSNAKVTRDRNGNWLLTKQSKFRKIDPLAAHLNAHVEYMRTDKSRPMPGASVVTVIEV